MSELILPPALDPEYALILRIAEAFDAMAQVGFVALTEQGEFPIVLQYRGDLPCEVWCRFFGLHDDCDVWARAEGKVLNEKNTSAMSAIRLALAWVYQVQSGDLWLPKTPRPEYRCPV